MVTRAIGIIFITAGLIFLAGQTGIISVSMDQAWPLFVLLPGLLFEVGYLGASSGKKQPGLLVPGGILTTIGLLFFFEVATGWRFSSYTWPIYPGAVAFGLFQLYVGTGYRYRGLLIPIGINASVPLVAFPLMLAGKAADWFFSGPAVGLVFIAIGAWVMLRKK